MHRIRLLLVFAFLSCLMMAQDYRAKVQGTVSDSTSAVIAGATVRLRNQNTGVEVTRTTNPNGQFLFDFVDPGTYDLTVEMAGFGKFVQQNILVQTRGDVTVNPNM